MNSQDIFIIRSGFYYEFQYINYAVKKSKKIYLRYFKKET